LLLENGNAEADVLQQCSREFPYSGNVWESNPPETGTPPHNGFEVRGPHQVAVHSRNNPNLNPTLALAPATKHTNLPHNMQNENFRMMGFSMKRGV
jgi:hypothetical protein